MPFSAAEYTDPKHLKVALNIKVPWVYRNQLVKVAQKKGVSMNRLLVDIIEAAVPPS